MNTSEKRAMEAIGAIQAVLKELGVGYEREGNDLLRLTFEGNDIIMPVNLWIEPEYSLVTFGSVLPFRVKEEKLDETAIVLNDLNARLVNGAFYLDRGDRYIKFKITDSYLGAPVSKGAIRFQLELLLITVDNYNDLLYAFNEGSLDRIFFTTCL